MDRFYQSGRDIAANTLDSMQLMVHEERERA